VKRKPTEVVQVAQVVELAQVVEAQEAQVVEEAQGAQFVEVLPADVLQEEEEEEEEEEATEINCVKEMRDVIGNATNLWKQYLPRRTKEMILNASIPCTYYPLIIVYKYVYNRLISTEFLKRTLIGMYRQFSKYEDKIIRILRLQGKRDIMEKISKKHATLEEIIMSDQYPLSNLDYWAICESLKLPVILFSSMKYIKHLLNDVSWIRLGENMQTREYYFIRAPTEKESKTGTNEVHAYSMIPLGLLMEEMPDFQEAYQNAFQEESNSVISFGEYVSSFTNI
jgi:hypothetical protein